jgi:predicted secreted Zn-dependent protease
MLVRNHYMQQVKNNKEDSIALANHAREMTSKLAQALQARNDLDSLKPNIEDFFKCVDLSCI